MATRVSSVRGKLTYSMKVKVFELDGYECVYCGMPVSRKNGSGAFVKNRTVDHLSPISGLIGLPTSIINSIGNLVTAHYRCNQALKDIPVEQKNPRYGRFRKRED